MALETRLEKFALEFFRDVAQKITSILAVLSITKSGHFSTFSRIVLEDLKPPYRPEREEEDLRQIVRRARQVISDLVGFQMRLKEPSQQRKLERQQTRRRLTLPREMRAEREAVVEVEQERRTAGQGRVELPEVLLKGEQLEECGAQSMIQILSFRVERFMKSVSLMQETERNKGK